ncbi:QRFP-like peptide receptor [Gigantopelta aegis]|uniref:QRFP-like peptide receptor n=1 Tax=Gigantopelta aegis TaxID=1735272 RepID=UPI001B88DC89|nr:QRFP-like peptide receptor [Gigantopelta aegis]
MADSYNISDLAANETGAPHPGTPFYVFVWVTILNAVVFLVGLVGNVLVIVVVTKVREMKTSTNFCLMNLSIADLLVLLICQPAALLEFYGQERWVLGDFMCKLVTFSENLVTHASITIIVAVSCGRYYAVCDPLRTYSTGSRSKTMITMICVWVVVIAVTSPFLFMASTRQTLHHVDQEMVDVCETPIIYTWQKIYTVFIFFAFFVIPLAMLMYMYSVIIHHVLRENTVAGNDSGKLQAHKSRKQLVSMLIGIIVLFFVCILPFRIVALCMIFTPVNLVGLMGMEAFLNLIAFARVLVYINSAGNPIIYNIYSQKFRNAFKKCLGLRAASNRGYMNRNATVTSYTFVKPTAGVQSDSV